MFYRDIILFYTLTRRPLLSDEPFFRFSFSLRFLLCPFWFLFELLITQPARSSRRMYKSGLDLVLRVCVVGVELRGVWSAWLRRAVAGGRRRERGEGNAWHGTKPN
jgi:hypothetical protein